MPNEKIYLDVNIFREWFVRMIRGEKGKVFYIEFLSKRDEIEKHISIFGIAELIETLKKEPRVQHKKLTKELILALIDALRNTIGLEIIEEDKIQKEKFRGFFVSPKIVEFTYLCGDLKDSIHVEIARNNDLLFITKDDKIGQVKVIYPKVEGIRSLIRRYKKKN